ncbi:PHP domain-containing protein [Caproiciproducens sp. CPB-2]|uniref:PHP domain-containing protein n=1 Tax=Caproiciproducens sp. CPB-2 TaxID=3030017 RepID=UPI0023D9D273|nr:PHP domain-containing protein [Caproiciproducens sp. CPB-2]MDF1495513.1 PHP domain-containing protein [Caproiciproducens sp. CPB-2]
MNGFHNIDLHIHSCYSEDGEYTPAKLVQMCMGAGVTIMAIADHNCVKGSQEAVEIARHEHLRCYPAVEIDCTYQNTNFHVLGYDIQLESPDFEAIEQNVRRQCADASKERLRLINRMGFTLTETELKAITAGGYWSEHWTGEAFAEALLKNEKYLGSGILRPYREGGDRNDNPYVNFYWDYCSQGKPCYVGMTFPDMRDVIGIIHRNGGKSVLAHPGVNLQGNFERIDQLISLGLKGIEVYSSYHTPETARWFLNKAEQFGLFVTRGSDFHGKTKPMVQPGCCGTDKVS